MLCVGLPSRRLQRPAGGGRRCCVFAGVAQVLVQHGVPAVIAMRSEVMDETACSFAEKFYRALATGLPVDACVSEVRRALAAKSNPEWGTPVLYLRATDGRLFALDEGGGQFDDD